MSSNSGSLGLILLAGEGTGAALVVGGDETAGMEGAVKT